MKSVVAIFLCAFVGCLISGSSAKFLLQQECRVDDYKVYNVYVNVDNLEQYQFFNTLRKKFSLYLMREANKGGQMPFYLALEPQYQKAFEQALDLFKIKYELLSDNLQKLIDDRNTPVEGTLNTDGEMSWTAYHRLSTIEKWMSKIAREHDFVKKRIIGYSFWKHPIYALEISKNSGKKAIKIYANIHAIEWLSSAVVTCFLDRLLKSDGKGDDYDYLLNNYDWIIVPIQNPDGFWFTHEKCPMWRKNRSFNFAFNDTGLCFGADPNRNYDAFWGEAGYNLDDPCDHFYAGKKAESEPEVRAAVKYHNSFKKGYIRMSYHVHTYGQLVLRPYGHSTTLLPSNIDQINYISNAFVKGAKLAHNMTYTAGSSGGLLGYVSGSAKDWYYIQGVLYSVTIELRDRGQLGFFVPPAQILDTCDEFGLGLYASVRAAEETNLMD